MDWQSIKHAVLHLRLALTERGIRTDGAILFGSYAKGTATKESDIDLAIISRDFGKDRIAEGVLLNVLMYRIMKNAELIPISLKDYADPNNISPLLHEIKTTGKLLL